jgi:hypothetical protein
VVTQGQQEQGIQQGVAALLLIVSVCCCALLSGVVDGACSRMLNKGVVLLLVLAACSNVLFAALSHGGCSAQGEHCKSFTMQGYLS